PAARPPLAMPESPALPLPALVTLAELTKRPPARQLSEFPARRWPPRCCCAAWLTRLPDPYIPKVAVVDDSRCPSRLVPLLVGYGPTRPVQRRGRARFRRDRQGCPTLKRANRLTFTPASFRTLEIVFLLSLTNVCSRRTKS